MNIKEALIFGSKYLNDNKIEESNLKSKILLMNILNVSKEYLIIHDTEEIKEEYISKFKVQLDELKNGKPIQYITCKQEFMGFNFYVDENVLIPQPDTEILVEEVVKIAKENRLINCLDICTGSGAIAISIDKLIDKAAVTASDISKEALEVAKKNARDNNSEIKFILSDMFENIDQKFDLIVSNPPYIEENMIKKLPKEVQNEPLIALYGGKDGLAFYNIIAKEGKNFLNKNGYVAVEIGYDQKEKVMEIFMQEGYKEVYSKKDFGGNDRIVVAKV